jgi:hypothetical protein
MARSDEANVHPEYKARTVAATAENTVCTEDRRPGGLAQDAAEALDGHS